MEKYIAVIGSSMLDIFGQTGLKALASGCHDGQVKLSHGGVARNIAENLLRLNIPVKFVSVFGTDYAGEAMYDVLKQLGCDLSLSLRKAEASAAFMALTAEDGSVLSAVASGAIMRHLTLDYLLSQKSMIEGAFCVIFDVNDYGLYREFVKAFPNLKIIIDPVSAFKAGKIKELLPYFDTVKPNRREAEVLCGFALNNDLDIKKAGNYFIGTGVKNVVITLGEDGVYYKNAETEGFLRAPDVSVINDVGAGDAFAAGLAYGYYRGLRFKETVKTAYAASLINLKSEQTVSPETSEQEMLHLAKVTNWRYK